MLKLQRKSLKWALEHINKYHDNYIFPVPFEFEAINEYKDEVFDYIEELNISDFGIQSYRTEITPKSQIGFRISTQLDPLDSVIYNAVLYEIFESIEKNRIPKEQNIVFSYRMDPENDGTLYDTSYDWDAFNNEAKRIIASGEYSYVVVTDIADFYPSIYLHNIETALREAVAESGKMLHAEVLIRVIKGMHVSQTHKGLPIGPQFSRPIAELILNEVDNILIKNGIKFIRYVDDYRIFCKSETMAYRTLSFIAQKLYDLRNLKLNESKTNIYKTDVFNGKYIEGFKDKENNSIISNFHNLCDSLGISTSSYEDVDISDLTEDQKKQLGQLNIIELLKEEISNEFVDLGLIRFLLNNLARFDNIEAADIILSSENIVKIFPILNSFINYLERVRSFSESQKHQIGYKVLNLFNESFITELQFNRAWLLHLFTKNQEWNNIEKFITLQKLYEDNITKRELILCFGRAHHFEYFRENKMKNTTCMEPWERRAFIAAISCLPKDERKAWFSSQEYKHRDYLDKIIEKWAIKNHF